MGLLPMAFLLVLIILIVRVIYRSVHTSDDIIVNELLFNELIDEETIFIEEELVYLTTKVEHEHVIDRVHRLLDK